MNPGGPRCPVPPQYALSQPHSRSIDNDLHSHNQLQIPVPGAGLQPALPFSHRLQTVVADALCVLHKPASAGLLDSTDLSIGRDRTREARHIVMEPMKRDPIIFLISAPSGTGKGTVVSALLEEVQNLSRIITTTSRPKREGEIEGISYYFIPRTEFETLIREGAFVEWNRIYGDLYGTKKDIVERFIRDAGEKGRDLILEIDVDGKRNFAREYGNRVNVVPIFLLPPSREELERRIKSRKADSPAQMRKRLARAKMELARQNEYDYRVVNDSKDAAVEEIKAIITCERAKRRRS